MDSKKDRVSKDDFWDIESLLPKKSEAKPKAHVSFDTNAVDVSVESRPKAHNITAGSALTADRGSFDAKRRQPDTEIVRYIGNRTPDEYKVTAPPCLEYESDNYFIHKVSIYDWHTKYSYNERFVADAVRLYKVKGEPADSVPFFSYTPQYSQLGRGQLAWYLWWRDNIRRGIYLDTAYSYILLYIYEIINLSPHLNKQACVDRLCDLWLHYGETYEFVGKYLCEWVCDLCLINQLPPPKEKLKPLYPFILKNALLKEFYISGDSGIGGISADTLMAMCSTYDYKKSRYATEDRLPTIERYMRGAVERILSLGLCQGPVEGMSITENLVLRVAYTGALCSAEVKKKIEVKYSSVSRTYELRYLAADIMKYTENKLRAAFGIRSRLSIYALPTAMRKAIDEYFLEYPIKRAENTDRNGNAEINEYDKFYDAPKTEFSAENAERIEKSSWDTTKILVEAFEDDAEVPAVLPEEKPPEPIAEEPADEGDLRQTLGRRYDFLLAVKTGDAVAQRRIAAELSTLPAALADEINETAYDIIGDVIIEEADDGGYRVIEEYEELI